MSDIKILRKEFRHVDPSLLHYLILFHYNTIFALLIFAATYGVEPLFGEAKDYHRLRRFRLRGLMKVNIEGVMIAAGQNLKRLIRHTGE
ncbi:transposase [Chloroflexota bacterium]